MVVLEYISKVLSKHRYITWGIVVIFAIFGTLEMGLGFLFPFLGVLLLLFIFRKIIFNLVALGCVLTLLFGLFTVNVPMVLASVGIFVIFSLISFSLFPDIFIPDTDTYVEFIDKN